MNGSKTTALLALAVVCWGCFGACGAGGVSAQTLKFEQVGSFPGPPEMHWNQRRFSRIRAEGSRLYVAGGATLTIFDVSNPAAPIRRGDFTFPEQIWGVRIYDSRAYVGANFFGLGILDVSDADSPRLVGSFKSLGQVKVGAVYGAKVVLIDHMEGLVMLDTSNEAEPVSVGSFFLDGYARDVTTSGALAYAVDTPTGLYIFDLARPGPLEPIGVLHAPNAPHSIEVSEAPGGGRSTVVCGIAAGALQIYDVSDPTAPVRAASFRVPGQAQRISFKGEVAYVAAGRGGLQIVDLSTPSRPRIIGEYASTGPVRDVAVSDSLVFLVIGSREGDAEVLILRQIP